MSKWNNLEEIKLIVEKCYTYSDVLRSLDLPSRGDNFITLKNFINKNKISISHFVINSPSNYSKLKISNKERKIEDIFVINSDATSKILRRKITKFSLITYECGIERCNIKDEWLGGKLVLALDHINGIWHDNRIENLRFLCPNCHSQTDTYVGKNGSKYKRLQFEINNKEFVRGRGKLNFQQLIKEESNKTREEVNYFKQDAFLIKGTEVNKVEIQKEVLDYPISKVAKKYNCSDSGLRKTLVKRGIFLPAAKHEGYWIKLEHEKINKIIYEDLICENGKYIEKRI